jgi:hypothetical protein
VPIQCLEGMIVALGAMFEVIPTCRYHLNTAILNSFPGWYIYIYIYMVSCNLKLYHLKLFK